MSYKNKTIFVQYFLKTNEQICQKIIKKKKRSGNETNQSAQICMSSLLLFISAG